jgi:rare lipoprotein A
MWNLRQKIKFSDIMLRTLCLSVIFLAACTSVSSDLRPPAIPTKTLDNCRFYQSGEASWYGYELYGNRTANGEKFDPEGITAAHPKLPFGTKVKVVLDHPKFSPNEVTVRINDRGPYKDGRIIDLSLAAAQKLGMESTSPVHIYVCK